MKIISLWQPWASLFVHGEKQIETRSWPVPRSIKLPFTLGVHAAKKWDEELAAMCRDEPFAGALKRIGYRWSKYETNGDALPFMPFGALLGTVEIYECASTRLLRDARFVTSTELEFGDYRDGRFGWCARNFKPYAEPVYMRGFQGLWDDVDEKAPGLFDGGMNAKSD